MAKGQMYVTMTEQEKMAFLGLSGKEPYKMKGHSFAMMKYGGKQYCKSCGLVALRNKATQWCIDKGCNYSDHKQYDSAMKRLAGFKFN